MSEIVLGSEAMKRGSKDAKLRPNFGMATSLD